LIVILIDSSEVIGYYSWTYLGSKGPKTATMSIAFSGIADVPTAISQYTGYPALNEEKWICIGGGVVHADPKRTGAFNTSNINWGSDEISSIKTAGYKGVMFDIEVITNSADDMIPLFAQTFKLCKNNGLKVGVTTSHSAPYGARSGKDSIKFVNSWINDANIDIISPQIYSTGNEDKNDYELTGICKPNCSWSLYKNSNAKFVPSITKEELY
jgi:hypothetical protein